MTDRGADHVQLMDRPDSIGMGICRAGTAPSQRVRILTRAATVRFFEQHLMGKVGELPSGPELVLRKKTDHVVRTITPPGIGVPSAPTGATAVAGDTQAFVTWTVSASNGGSPITSYTVNVLDNGIGTAIFVTVPPPAFGSNTDSALVGGLTNGHTYTFTVQATNIAGFGAASNLSNAVIPSAANLPTVTIAMSGPTSVARHADTTDLQHHGHKHIALPCLKHHRGGHGEHSPRQHCQRFTRCQWQGDNYSDRAPGICLWPNGDHCRCG